MATTSWANVAHSAAGMTWRTRSYSSRVASMAAATSRRSASAARWRTRGVASGVAAGVGDGAELGEVEVVVTGTPLWS